MNSSSECEGCPQYDKCDPDECIFEDEENYALNKARGEKPWYGRKLRHYKLSDEVLPSKKQKKQKVKESRKAKYNTIEE